jgi:hypothetical protein
VNGQRIECVGVEKDTAHHRKLSRSQAHCISK